MTEEEIFEERYGVKKRSFKSYLHRRYKKNFVGMSQAEREVYIQDYLDFRFYSTYEKEELVDIIKKLINNSALSGSEKDLINYIRD